MKIADKRCQELESKFWKRASLSRAAQYEDTDNHKRSCRSKSSEPGSNTKYQDEPSEKRLRHHQDFVAADQDTIEIDDDDHDDDEHNASQPRGCVLEDPKLQDDDRDPEQIYADKFASRFPPPYRMGTLVISDPRLSKQESSGANTENEDTQYDGLSGSMRTQHQVDNSPVDLTSDDN
jgi:hypothetical protein